jgi:hypothetical protein
MLGPDLKGQRLGGASRRSASLGDTSGRGGGEAQPAKTVAATPMNPPAIVEPWAVMTRKYYVDVTTRRPHHH